MTWLLLLWKERGILSHISIHSQFSHHLLGNVGKSGKLHKQEIVNVDPGRFHKSGENGKPVETFGNRSYEENSILNFTSGSAVAR